MRKYVWAAALTATVVLTGFGVISIGIMKGTRPLIMEGTPPLRGVPSKPAGFGPGALHITLFKENV